MLFFICLQILPGVSELFRFFSSILGGIKLSKDICYPSITSVFLQQPRQLHKHNVLKPKFHYQLCKNFYPADFAETCSQQTVKSWNAARSTRKNLSLVNGNIRVILKRLVFKQRLYLLIVKLVCPETKSFVNFEQSLLGIPNITEIG